MPILRLQPPASSSEGFGVTLLSTRSLEQGGDGSQATSPDPGSPTIEGTTERARFDSGEFVFYFHVYVSTHAPIVQESFNYERDCICLRIGTNCLFQS